MTGKILSIMPEKSVIYLYGKLSGNNITHINPEDIISRQKTIKGFSIFSYLELKGSISNL